MTNAVNCVIAYILESYCFGHTLSIVIPGGEAMSFDPGQDSTLRERPKGLCALGCGAWGADLFLSSLVFN